MKMIDNFTKEIIKKIDNNLRFKNFEVDWFENKSILNFVFDEQQGEDTTQNTTKVKIIITHSQMYYSQVKDRRKDYIFRIRGNRLRNFKKGNSLENILEVVVKTLEDYYILPTIEEKIYNIEKDIEGFDLTFTMGLC